MRIITAGILDGYQRRKDKTVSLRFVTQEKTSSEVMTIDELTDTYGILYFKAGETMEESELEGLESIDLDLYDHPKTQSQRIRNVIYKVWESQGKRGEFKTFYKQKTDAIIEYLKSQIEL